MQYYNLIPKLGEGPTAMAHVVSTGIEREIIYKLMDGEKIHDIDMSKAKIKNITKKFPDVIGTGSSEYFVTNAFKRVIEGLESAENMHFIAVTLVDKQYWLLNILNNIECFDFENSEYSVREGNPRIIRDIKTMALMESRINGRHIFRVAEKPVYIFISQTLKDAIEANNLTGIEYDNIFEIKTT